MAQSIPEVERIVVRHFTRETRRPKTGIHTSPYWRTNDCEEAELNILKVEGNGVSHNQACPRAAIFTQRSGSHWKTRQVIVTDSRVENVKSSTRKGVQSQQDKLESREVYFIVNPLQNEGAISCIIQTKSSFKTATSEYFGRWSHHRAALSVSLQAHSRTPAIASCQSPLHLQSW
jgi:hypothetical protein